MKNVTRRELLQQSAMLAAAARLGIGESQAAPAGMSTYEWIRSTRILIAEAYNPPFYPTLDYRPEKAVSIARELNADALRYPSASYFAYFPTRSGYPIHPELKGDPMRDTVDLSKQAGLRVVAYVPLNHPFMNSTSKDPRYADWSKKFANGKPMITSHYGYATFFEGCLNSPLREVIRTLVREVLTQYGVDVMYFDGPYQGMDHRQDFCHCKYCQAAYQKKFGKAIPNQDEGISLSDDIQYQNWMANDVGIGFFREIREMIRQTRDVPVLFNDTSLLSRREWRSRAIPVADGFMFEAAETPEEKLFNMQLGQSTGKVTWTYVGSHTEYNREHMKDTTVRGWYSYPVESQELLIDGATAIAAGVGIVYWSMSRFFYNQQGPLAYESGRYVKEVFDFQQKHDALLRTLISQPQVGIMVGGQTLDWYTGKHFVGRAYPNYFHGAYQLLKANSYEAEPFLDWNMSPELLSKYQMIYAPNCACLSAKQCGMLRDYVRKGGALIATHLTSVADEYGRVCPDFGLADVFGASFLDPEPLEMPDLYMNASADDIMPQDPQVMRIRENGGRVFAETIDRGHRTTIGPAGVGNTFGDGKVIYIASGLEAIYEETEMPILRSWFAKLFEPYLGAKRSYQIEYQPGLTPHLMASKNTIVLHLLADTGNKNKHLRPREGFLAVADVKVRIKVPSQPKSVSLLRSGAKIPVTQNSGWIELTVPRVLIHEAVGVDLG
ncbi:MAG: alpha-amylase family protein [Bryobacteraceae bacterium]|jgi:hypothetical protein